MTDYDIRRIDPTDMELSTCPTCKNTVEKNIAQTWIKGDIKSDNYYCIYCEVIWIKDLTTKHGSELKITPSLSNKITLKSANK